MQPAECLDDLTLDALVEGQLADAALQEADAHIDSCGTCRELVIALARATGGASTLDAGAAIGRYRVKGLLGRGGFGVVYLAFDAQLDRDVAIKVLPADASDDTVREARSMAKLQHPNVVTVHEVIELPDGDVAIVMEYVRGATLRDAMQTAPRDKLDELFEQAARGLAAAHDAGLVHRDFKPENILVGTDDRARVADFGLAGGLASGVASDAESGADAVDVNASIARGGALIGTPAYMAPEQLRGDGADARSDQYAWCVAYWEALTGTRPSVHCATVPELLKSTETGPPAVPGDVGHVDTRVLRTLQVGLAADPNDRHSSMSALLTALRDGREMKRSRGWIFGLGAAAAVAAAIGIAATNSADPASTRAEPLVGQTPKNMTHPAPSSAPLQTTPAEKLLEQGDLLGAEKSGLARLNTVQASGDVRATAQAWLVLARVATARGRLSEADQRCDHVTAHLKRHPEPTLRQRQLHLTGVVRTQQERFDDATKALEAAVALHGELSKPPVDLAELEVALGDLYRAKGDLTRATAHHRKARRLDAERHGPEHVSAARHDHNLARIRLLEGKSVEAEGLYRRALKTKQRYLGAAHPQLALTYNSLGLLHAASGDHQQAIENYRRALTILKTGFPLRVATCRYNLGLSLLALKRPADAARELDSAKTGFELLMGPEHAQTKAAIAALAKAGGGAQPAVATDVTGKAPGTARPDVAASTARPASAARAAASKPPPPPAPLPPAPSRPKTRKPKPTPRPTSGSYMSDRGW